MTRTLIISPNWIGDAVMAQPLLTLLKLAHPERPIDVLAPAWVAPVWRAMAEVDSVIDTSFRHGALQLRERWRCARQLRERDYAAAYVLPNTFKFALIPWLSGIAQRIGYVGESRYGLLNMLHRDDKQLPRPMVAFYAALANSPAPSVPQPSELPRPKLTVDTARVAAVVQAAKLDAARPLVVFAPGAEFGSAKRWPITHFAELAVMLQQAIPDVQVVILGSEKDRAVGDAITTIAPFVTNLAGSTALEEAIALIAKADAVISNDSGLLHIASALNRKIVALYGPTDPAHAPPFADVVRTIYLALECAPCKQRECPLGHHRCMKDISAEVVLEALREMDGAAVAA
ncbi:lipopolysaccharide heptosyltransferase II [Actimicrobium sp. CCI2.3]|uniref:lipopolysaccharide heptosyltransferase II n=1 Tax=Actimicrobium sp. CCI2.3 TaxID=3048616 RepID=UPI002AB4EFE4|nr:lipopolysaccharide heptosyltransferase II [Actimicrobium sp. CCI2.3]MDY7573697.1 lipopolysaccharide heptosyltransferase II [Actimicrobium sp. CCI2.3]MEB0021031.1 lipopolysaccharide heptosyltransferase II [Actimicrobium sp. CCI2.3]